MASLHLRNMPDELYERVRELAEVSNRSLDEEALALLEEGVKKAGSPSNPEKILEEIRAWRTSRPAPGEVPDSTALIREDRNR